MVLFGVWCPPVLWHMVLFGIRDPRGLRPRRTAPRWCGGGLNPATVRRGRSTPKPPAEGYGGDRRVLPGKPDAIHSGARKAFPPLVGRQQASSRRLGCRTLSLIS
jgi:hypothetical protein